MAKKRNSVFVCSNCGWESAQWLGLCGSCSSWNTLQEVVLQENNAQKTHKAKMAQFEKGTGNKVCSLDQVPVAGEERMLTGMGELDRVLGGGMTPGSFILLGGDPGIGKSTLALQCASLLDQKKTLYVSGEESLVQIRQRAHRLGIRNGSLRLFSENGIMEIIDACRSEKPGILIIDSIQTMYHSSMQSMPGTIAQIRECAGILMQLARQEQITVLAIGHVTKEGDLAGPRVLEHMVDTVLQFEGDKQSHHRIIRTLKNRYGPAQEVGIFEMDATGLKEISNPSELFLSEYDPKISGNAVVCSIEGTRPLLIEVQALVTPSSYGMPQRTASGFDNRRLSLLLAVLEKRCGWQFSTHDVFLNVAGGMKITETSSDLGVACALVSSLSGKAPGEPMVMIGEIGLGAEIRRVAQLSKRLDEAEAMGFRQALVPDGYSETRKKINISVVRNIDDALNIGGLG